MTEEQYIRVILDAAHAYIRRVQNPPRGKALRDLWEVKRWDELRCNMGAIFIIDLCEAWRELQKIKADEAIKASRKKA